MIARTRPGSEKGYLEKPAAIASAACSSGDTGVVAGSVRGTL